jgi:MtN3 and saliva related transmembrane protein
MDQITYIGLFAAIFTTAAFIPQVIAILRTGNVDGISISMYSIFTIGVALWLSYGILVNDLPMLLANSITLVLALSVLGLTIFKRFKNKQIAKNEGDDNMLGEAV